MTKSEETEAMNKILTWEALKKRVDLHRKEGKTIVFTNGCFDIVHAGHASTMAFAKQQGDVLIVGLNSDASVRENKGPNRPVVSEGDRAIVLSALECVGYLTIFGEKTTVRILETVRPDVYAKGGDYSLSSLVQEERLTVESYGGKVVIIPAVAGQSTTNIIQKISGDK